jgi:hypothetical protein
VPVAVAIALGRIDEPLDLGRRQVLSGLKIRWCCRKIGIKGDGSGVSYFSNSGSCGQCRCNRGLEASQWSRARERPAPRISEIGREPD